MDDRTIIDDDSMRITDVMQAKPGDLMVLGRMEGDVFKQKAWLTVTGVRKEREGITESGICALAITIFIGDFRFYALMGSDRVNYELCICIDGNQQLSGLYFDCFIRPKQHHKKGIYKNKHNSNAIFFDGKGSFNFICDPAKISEALPAETFLDFDQYTLVYAFDEDDDHGEKNI